MRREVLDDLEESDWQTVLVSLLALSAERRIQMTRRIFRPSPLSRPCPFDIGLPAAAAVSLSCVSRKQCPRKSFKPE